MPVAHASIKAGVGSKSNSQRPTGATDIGGDCRMLCRKSPQTAGGVKTLKSKAVAARSELGDLAVAGLAGSSRCAQEAGGIEQIRLA